MLLSRVLLSRGKALDKDKDRGWGNRASYNLHKDTDSWGSYRDTDMCMDRGNSILLDTGTDMYMPGYNSTRCNRAFDTDIGMDIGTGIRNPDRHCRRYIAILKLKEPGITSQG